MRGDFSQLKAFIKKVGDTARLQELIAKAVRDEALTQVQLGFREERDPDGVPWLPLKHRQGQILSLTGRLRRSYNARFVRMGKGVGIRIASNVKYAKFHQYGTKHMAARRMVPQFNGKLGKAWAEPIATAARNVVFKFWGRR